MDNSNQLRDSFYKYVNHEADAGEAEAFLDHLHSGKDKDAIIDLIEEVLSVPVEVEILESAGINTRLDNTLSRLKSQINPRGAKSGIKLFPWLMAAASMIIIGGLALFFYLSNLNFASDGIDKYGSDAKPGSNKAILKLADGKTIILNGNKKGVIIDAAKLIYDDGSTIIDGSEKVQMVTMQTPKGGQYEATLPDGTHIWLNAASILKFPSKFTGKDRSVELLGEAYFEVAHNKAIPFHVKTGQQEIEVLGTHFNINAYEDDPDTKTTLLQGSVRVSKPGNPAISKLLIPGQQAIVHHNQIILEDVDAKDAIAWKNGLFIFENETLEQALHKITRWYDLKVIYEDNTLRQLSVGGSVSRFEHVSGVLDLFEKSGKVNFKIEGRTLIVTKH